jgi:protein TonB
MGDVRPDKPRRRHARIEQDQRGHADCASADRRKGDEDPEDGAHRNRQNVNRLVIQASEARTAKGQNPIARKERHGCQQERSREYAWQQLLQAQLERFKRYPRRARGAHGKVTVAFTVGRNGSVLSSHIIQGSGSAILDEEALALIKRAQPSPPPPSAIADNQLNLVVPINYVVSRQ